ncbi:MAG: glycosyltransferase family 4 protein, partial [Acidobacteriota bacterium]|nr:glycosyltransferase family 4 protein [Acidobacteriota bacterium]
AINMSARRREPRLTVAVDIAAFWEPLTGIGWYLYRLLEHLAHRDDLRLRLYPPTTVWSHDLSQPAVPLPTGPAIELVRRTVPDELLFPAGWVIKLLRRLEPLLIAADANTVLFAPNFFLPRRFRLARAAQVATIHDLGVKRVPWTLRRATMRELRERLEHQVYESERLITVSSAVRDELVECGYAERERVHVVHHGPGQLAAVEPGPLPSGTPELYGLHVGTLEPRKNITVLIDAWRRARAKLPDCPPLVLCGRYGWKAGAIRSAVQQAVTEGWAHHLGYVDDPQLAALYRGAEIVVFPTVYEGFGLPAVEALFADTPLVCSDLPVLRESTGEAALFVPPGRADLLADAIVSVLTEPDVRHELIVRGRRRVAQLSWSRSADLTARVWFAAAGRTEGKGTS